MINYFRPEGGTKHKGTRCLHERHENKIPPSLSTPGVLKLHCANFAKRVLN